MNIYDDLTLVIVSYRSEKLILKNLDILKKFKTIIIDNSNSSELELIVKYINNIAIIKSPKNLGYGKAVNRAVKNVDTTFILLINPDLILNEDSIKILFEVFLKDKNNIGILAPSLFDEKMKNRSHGTISILEKLNGRKVSNSVNNIAVGNTCCKFLMGSCYLMKRDFFNFLGGFDETFFMYFEDNDLCDRSIQAGKYIMEVPSSKFIHLGDSSSEKKKFTGTKLSVIHKISYYLYLRKKTSIFFFTFQIIKNFFDYFQRLVFNFLKFKFKKSYKNFLRLVSLLLYITSLYKIIYNYWNI